MPRVARTFVLTHGVTQQSWFRNINSRKGLMKPEKKNTIYSFIILLVDILISFDIEI